MNFIFDVASIIGAVGAIVLGWRCHQITSGGVFIDVNEEEMPTLRKMRGDLRELQMEMDTLGDRLTKLIRKRYNDRRIYLPEEEPSALSRRERKQLLREKAEAGKSILTLQHGQKKSFSP